MAILAEQHDHLFCGTIPVYSHYKKTDDRNPQETPLPPHIFRFPISTDAGARRVSAFVNTKFDINGTYLNENNEHPDPEPLTADSYTHLLQHNHNLVLTPCAHLFEETELAHWSQVQINSNLSVSCPMCRSTIIPLHQMYLQPPQNAVPQSFFEKQLSPLNTIRMSYRSLPFYIPWKSCL